MLCSLAISPSCLGTNEYFIRFSERFHFYTIFFFYGNNNTGEICDGISVRCAARHCTSRSEGIQLLTASIRRCKWRCTLSHVDQFNKTLSIFYLKSTKFLKFRKDDRIFLIRIVKFNKISSEFLLKCNNFRQIYDKFHSNLIYGKMGKLYKKNHISFLNFYWKILKFSEIREFYDKFHTKFSVNFY